MTVPGIAGGGGGGGREGGVVDGGKSTPQEMVELKTGVNGGRRSVEVNMHGIERIKGENKGKPEKGTRSTMYPRKRQIKSADITTHISFTFIPFLTLTLDLEPSDKSICTHF